MPDLPLEPLIPALLDRLKTGSSVVLQAPPGAGKTTRVPLALLDAEWLGARKIIVIEPRRIAARGAARRMAESLGEIVGETVGWRMRLDTKIGPRTRIEVVTDGLFTRRIQQDPELTGIGAILFDEFHERRLESDLGLALALESRSAFRPDLRLIVMSATLDGEAVSRLIDGPVMTSEGRAFPVDTRYLRPEGRIEDAVAAAIRRALAEDAGDILVFLPGLPEIRRVARAIEDLPPHIDCHLLHGDIGIEAQDLAIRPAPEGRRKVVLASAIAETSLTIEGVSIVIDSGLMRVARHDPESGIASLETIRVTLASADQRRGRAGRLGPGICYRLWAEAETRGLLPYAAPEIETADLAPLALELALWGGGLAQFPTPPPRAGFAVAQDLLRDLGALDQDGRITSHGRAMAEIGLHPRLAHMLVRARKAELGGLAADLAAILSERDPLRAAGADLRSRLEALRSAKRDPALDRMRRLARQWRGGGWTSSDLEETGRLVAWAYPERIAGLRQAKGTAYRMANGKGAELDPLDGLAGNAYLAIADVDGRIRLAAPVTRDAIEADFTDGIIDEDLIAFDPREGAVIARRRRRFEQLVLSDRLLPDAPAEKVTAALIDALRGLGASALNWDASARQLRARVALLARHFPEASWPDWSDDALAAELDRWLGPALTGLTRLLDVKKLALAQWLMADLSHVQRRDLDRLAPTHLTVPSGSSVALDYVSGAVPVLAVKLQEMFGLAETPKLGGGRIPVLIHLLSPAGRPVQVTSDLGGFWRSSYAAVRSDLRGRYPKHAWPEDPMAAVPHRGTKKKVTQ